MGRAYEVRKASMEKTSQAKAKVYSRFGKEIYMAAKAGEPDPEMNTGLKRTIEKAKANQVPADVIKRAIEKAKGGTAESYNEIRYEGFGPGASTIIVDCLSDNVNRTVSEVRTAFNKSKGKMGVSGSVVHFYDNVGLLSFSFDSEEKVLETLLEHDVDVIDVESEDGSITVITQPSDLYKAKDALDEGLGEINYDVLEVTFLPQEKVDLDADETVLFERLTRMLDDLDDVQQVYHNVNV